jgi:hypothetical protein
MKKFILGLIVGLMIPIATVYATEYTIIQNPFPIYVDKEQQDVDALNINGSTWLRLGSVGGVLGVSVLFDEVNNQINITTEESTTTTDETGSIESSVQNTAESKFTPDGLEAHYSHMYNGIYVVPFTYFNAKYEPQGYRITKLRLALPVCLYKGDNIILEGVEKFGNAVEYDYYVNTILPLIQ